MEKLLKSATVVGNQMRKKWMKIFNLFKKKCQCYSGKIIDVYDDATLKIKCNRCSKIFIRKACHYTTDKKGVEEIRAKIEIIKNIPWNRWQWYRIDGLADILTDHNEQQKIENSLWKIRLLEPQEE
jgi:hypothetical protein